jgi:hypothetical protein
MAGDTSFKLPDCDDPYCGDELLCERCLRALMRKELGNDSMIDLDPDFPKPAPEPIRH